MSEQKKAYLVYIPTNAVTLKPQPLHYGKILYFFRQLLTDYCRVSKNFKCTRFKLHKFHVAILDTVTFTGDCSPIENSGPKESVGRAKLPVLMIVIALVMAPT